MASTILLLTTLVAVPADTAGMKTERAKRDLEAVSEYLSVHKAKGGDVLAKTDPALAEVFPNHTFFAVRYRQFPVARVLPPGFKPSNVLVVSKESKVLHLKDDKAMVKFFQEHAPESRTAGALHSVLSAWLALSQEHYQDGFYKFEVVEREFGVNKERTEVSGRAIVMQGGNGDIKTTLHFEDGKLAKAIETATLRPGPRPICQATKLLDPDPIVRQMAEQDLLIMGVAARHYLQEQRADAAPELRRAIDALWQRIEKNGW